MEHVLFMRYSVVHTPVRPLHASGISRLWLNISIIYLMDFLYLQRGLESKPCREILYIPCTHIIRVLFCVQPPSTRYRQ